MRNGPWLNRNGTKVNIILKFQPTKKFFGKSMKMKNFFGGFFGRVLTNIVPLGPIRKIFQPFRGRRGF